MFSSHFGKKQTTLLVVTVFYRNDDNEVVKTYYDFISEYLGHNNIFYEKCMKILLEKLSNTLQFQIKSIYNVSDGRNHFVNRYAF
jgi:hypothetical protein